MKKRTWMILLLSAVLMAAPAIQADETASPETGAPESTVVSGESSQESEEAADPAETPSEMPVETPEETTAPKVKDGWNARKTSYIREGKKVTGLQTIGKKQYIFNNKGNLIKDKICYSVKEKKDFRYFDISKTGVAKEWTGVYAQAAARLKSLKAVPKKTTESFRTSALKKAFLWSATLKKSSPSKPGLNAKQALEYYGNYGFLRKSGECITQAATFAAMAKVLRFDAKLMLGYVKTESGLSEHAWVQIKSGKIKYAYDPNFNTWSFVASLRKQNKYLGFGFKYMSKNTLSYYTANKKLIKK